MSFITQGKTNWKPLLIVIILVAIVGGGALWYAKKPKQPYKSPEEIKKSEEIADWRIYRNEWYGFELIFPERWKGYKVEEEKEGVQFSLLHSEDQECRPVFYISVFSKEIWEQSKSDESSNVGTYITEKGNNVFSYSLWKTYGDKGYAGFPEVIDDKDYQGPFFDAQTKIIPSFRLIDLGICEYRKGDYEMRVYDSQGRITGLVNGEIKEEIPNSIYDEESGTAAIFDPQDSYIYELFCLTEGSYQFGQSSIQGGEEISFEAINIPILPGTTHRYLLNWEVLAQGKNGVTLLIDADGNGIFEKTITSDTKLTCEEFLSQTK